MNYFFTLSMLILLNGCYGGYHIAEKYMKHANDNHSLDDIIMRYADRTDPTLIALYLKYGDIGAKYSLPYLDFVPDKYRDYFKIHEYDGQESIRVDYAKYKMDTIKKLAEESDCVSSDEILRIYNETDNRSSAIYDEEYNREIAALPNIDDLIIDDEPPDKQTI